MAVVARRSAALGRERLRRRPRGAHDLLRAHRGPRSGRCSSSSPRRPASHRRPLRRLGRPRPADRRGGRPQSPADVFSRQSPGAIGLPRPSGLLAPPRRATSSTWSTRASRTDDGPLGRRASGRQRVLVYNTEMVDRGRPARLGARPHRARSTEGRVGVAPTNGSFQDFVTAMRDIEGDEATAAWLAGMADNDARTYANNNAIVEAVGRGEIDHGAGQPLLQRPVPGGGPRRCRAATTTSRRRPRLAA